VRIGCPACIQEFSGSCFKRTRNRLVDNPNFLGDCQRKRYGRTCAVLTAGSNLIALKHSCKENALVVCEMQS